MKMLVSHNVRAENYLSSVMLLAGRAMTFALLASTLLSPATSFAAPRSLDCELNEVETTQGRTFDLAPESRSISLTLDEGLQTMTLYQNGAGQALSHVTITQIAMNGYTDNTSVGIQVSSENIVLQSYALNFTKAEFGTCRPIQTP